MSHAKPKERPSTIMEPIAGFVDDIPDVASFTESEKPDNTVEKTKSYRPTSRPPMALLYVLDDNQKSYEKHRIRASSFVIGRTEGDFCVEHDDLISSQHARITRSYESGTYYWFLEDLNTTNGTYARISRALLEHGMTFLIGSTRYRLDLPHQGTQDESQPGTQLWDSSSNNSDQIVKPILVEITSEGDGKSIPFTKNEHWIGRDPKKASIILDDPMVGSRHARFYLDTNNRWCVEVTKTRNGLWVQIATKQSLGNSGSFQCGEQRFHIRVL